MCCKCCSVKQRQIWVYSFGTLFLALGIVLVVIWPGLSEDLVHKGLMIKPGSSSYDSWVQAPVPIYLDFYMFNWTNPHDLYNPNIKPHFEEVGPYVYLEKHKKEKIVFHPNNTVSYYERRSWHFDAQKSKGREHDLIQTAHPITATVADDMRHSNKFVKKIINFMLNREGGHLSVSKPLHEWIFDGYKDDLIDFLKLFNTSKIDIPYDRFGFLVDRNMSLEYDGLFTMRTGEGDITKLGQLTNWNGRNETGWYEMPCGTVNGTTGDVFSPLMDPEGEMTLFVTDTCRFMNLQPQGKTTHHGIDGIEWVGTIETLDSGENYPNQKCFCDQKREECPKTGVVDCKKCRDNAPIYASFPHFYLADPMYRDAIEGMNPIKEKHEFKMTVEPKTGVMLRINGRVQINLMIRPDNDFDIFRGVPEVLIPLFWFEQRTELDENLASDARLALKLESIGVGIGIGLICLGAVFYITAIILTVTKKWKSTSDDDDVVLTN